MNTTNPFTCDTCQGHYDDSDDQCDICGQCAGCCLCHLGVDANEDDAPDYSAFSGYWD